MVTSWDIVGYACIGAVVIVSFGTTAIIIAALMSGPSNETCDDDWDL